MKIVSRVLIILLAALIISGAAYGLSQLPVVENLIGAQGGEHQHGGEMPEGFEPGQNGPDRDMAEGGQHEGGSGGRVLVATGKNLTTIGIVLAAVVVLSLAWGQVQKFRRRSMSHQPAA